MGICNPLNFIQMAQTPVKCDKRKCPGTAHNCAVHIWGALDDIFPLLSICPDCIGHEIDNMSLDDILKNFEVGPIAKVYLTKDYYELTEALERPLNPRPRPAWRPSRKDPFPVRSG